MNDVTNIHPPRDPFNHPHAKIVKRLVEDCFKKIAGKTSTGYARLIFNNYPVRNERLVEQVAAYSAVLQVGSLDDVMNANAQIPLSAHVHLIKDLAEMPNTVRKLRSSYDTTVRILEFFFKYNYQHYLNDDMSDMLEVKEICIAIIELIKKLDKYCLSSIHYRKGDDRSSPDYKKSSFVHLGFLLKDELGETVDSPTPSLMPKGDFLMLFSIKSPAEALRTKLANPRNKK